MVAVAIKQKYPSVLADNSTTSIKTQLLKDGTKFFQGNTHHVIQYTNRTTLPFQLFKYA